MILVHKNVGLKQFWFQESFADLFVMSGVGNGVGGGVGGDVGGGVGVVGLEGFSCQT